MWDEAKIASLVQAQRDYFATGETLPVHFREEMLRRLKEGLKKHEAALIQALRDDLGRTDAEAYFCDIGTVITEVNEILHHLKKWAKPEKHFSGLMCFPSLITHVYKMPYGTTLVISPFNFPILLSLGVLAASIAGGNTVILKTSSKSAHCTQALQVMLSDTFPEKYVCLVDGGHDVADLCLAQRFDKIFYTGSPAVAKHVLEMAARNLTPVALELGGENGNWCVVRKDADLRDAARKIAFFKLLNAGQICININQVAVAREVAEPFLSCLKAEFTRQISENAITNPEYPRLISRNAYDKCAREADAYRDRILYGGTGDPDTLRYAPTIIYPVETHEAIVNHELFSPLLPVVPFDDAEIDTLLKEMQTREHPLALYLFTRDIHWANTVMQTQQYGGGCINEVCLHIMVKGVPFGGTGHSGMGAYHGEWGFREFTHPSTVLTGSTHLNLPLREHPMTGKKGKRKLRLIRLFER
ncbi:MAG: aldehyde dehydrogenase family protein [Clostridia bacterium]|nr:aldehyde dehydrogenase family protein [Clostridia bacterium]MBR1685336.1 aldehyde dehydrogenase family protein [Clostridia bacterium]MBR2288764.1 aldehyde dehydrogenase family protein [Clostridia bacterium]